MGSGLNMSCKNCHEEVTLMFGVGEMYPMLVEELKKNVLKGKYGKEWKKLITENPYYFINGEKSFYYCSKCHCFENTNDMSIYEPKEIGDKKPEDFKWGPMGKEDPDYKLVKKYSHLCPKCKQEMKEKTEDQVRRLKLKCPECGDDLVYDDFNFMLWD